jgi:hypothetical protein
LVGGLAPFKPFEGYISSKETYTRGRIVWSVGARVGVGVGERRMFGERRLIEERMTSESIGEHMIIRVREHMIIRARERMIIKARERMIIRAKERMIVEERMIIGVRERMVIR